MRGLQLQQRPQAQSRVGYDILWRRTELAPELLSDGPVSMTWHATDGQRGPGEAMVAFSGGPAADVCRGWTAAQAARWAGERRPSHIEQLLSKLSRNAGLVTIADAAPASLSWLGGVLGQRVAPLGVERFGQTGSLADLYAAYRLDGEAITEAVAELLLPA